MSNPTRSTNSAPVAPTERVLLLTSTDLPDEFQAGDYVGIAYGRPVKDGDYALVAFGETSDLRRIFFEPDGFVRLVSSKEVTLPASEVTILGRVMQGWRIYPPRASQEVKR